TERVELRRQEEALVAHEQALRARTDQLAQIERNLQDRSREIDARAAREAGQREDAERRRGDLLRELQAERASIAALRAKVEDELHAAKSRQAGLAAGAAEETAARRAELEREYAQLRAGIEAKVRRELEGQIQQRAAAEVGRKTSERLRQFDGEL